MTRSSVTGRMNALRRAMHFAVMAAFGMGLQPEALNEVIGFLHREVWVCGLSVENQAGALVSVGMHPDLRIAIAASGVASSQGANCSGASTTGVRFSSPGL